MKFDLPRLIKKIDGLDELTVPFTVDEIDHVIKMMPADRAPGPDGFNGDFIKACWDIISEEFYKLIEDFYEGTVNSLILRIQAHLITQLYFQDIHQIS